MSYKNLKAMFERADDIDRLEGVKAYRRYHSVMRELSDKYEVSLNRVVAAFVSLSPNSDYVGNLRSTVSILQAVAEERGFDTVQVSAYRHCGERAWAYATGAADFVERTRGPKVLSFYRNILDPEDPRPVTVDGHVTAAWRGQVLTMKQAFVRSMREYEEIAGEVRRLARYKGLLPNQMQAVLWFTRKRVLGIKYEPQRSLWFEADDAWQTRVPAWMITPFPQRSQHASSIETLVA
jgi:hypothetical protein